MLHICVCNEALDCLLILLPFCEHLFDIKNDSGETPRKIAPHIWEAVVEDFDANWCNPAVELVSQHLINDVAGMVAFGKLYDFLAQWCGNVSTWRSPGRLLSWFFGGQGCGAGRDCAGAAQEGGQGYRTRRWICYSTTPGGVLNGPLTGRGHMLCPCRPGSLLGDPKGVQPAPTKLVCGDPGSSQITWTLPTKLPEVCSCPDQVVSRHP